MALNIRDFARMCEFSFELKSLGTVRCPSLNTDHLSQANKKLGASGGQSIDFVRWLFGQMVMRPVEGCSGEADQTEAPRLTTEELSSVTDVELEEFAGKLIQKNRYLLKTHKGSDIELSADEPACDFLVRAFRHHAAEQKAQWELMTEPMSKSLFASTTLEAMQRNFVQQSALGTVAEANRYLTDRSATAAMERILKRDQELVRAIDPLKDMSRHLVENSASVAIATHLQREQDLMRAASSPFQDTQRYLEESSASAMLAKAIYRNEDMIREAARGLAQRETMSAVIAAGLEKQQQETRDLLKSHEAMFRLPQASEATRLLAAYQVGAVAEFAQQHAKDTLDRQRFLEAITTPWINSVEAARSVTAILELQGMGNALRTIKGFDLELTAALRLDLGDWRDKITFPESVFIDPVARSDFYVTRGFNTALTDFPEAAFHQSLDLVGLDGEILDFELNGSVFLPSADPGEEAGLQRTNKCHDRLQRFERRWRQFIDDVMTDQYGPDWPRKRLDPKLYEQWEFKKQRAESSGLNLTFIEVADFTDYETIICKRDHWREIFEARFKKKESVRESLQRLQPIRLAAMHARIVTKEDELYLSAEVVRLLSAIK